MDDTKKIEALAKPLRMLFRACSPVPFADCLLMARMGLAALADMGLQTTIQVGDAAWRVGPGDGDMIQHRGEGIATLTGGLTAMPFHAWLVDEAGRIIDYTTGDLGAKAALLDSADGGKTQVDWAPEVLISFPGQGLPFEAVRDAYTGGHYHYKPRPKLRLMMEKAGAFNAVDPDDLNLLRLVIRNPGLLLVGPTSEVTGAVGELKALSVCF